MIFALLFQLYLSFFLFITGIIIHCLTNDKQTKPHPTILFISGLIAQTLFAQAWSLFFPVNIYISLGLNGVLLTVFFALRKKTFILTTSVLQRVFKKDYRVYLCLALIFTCLIFLSAGPTMMDDTESYHLQTVRWLQEWGTVPGLANLHLRYGFHTSWLTGVALYSIPNGHNYYTALNCSVSIWLVLYLIVPETSDAKNKKSTTFITACRSTSLVLVVLWSLLRKNSSSTNYDFITAACTLILIAETIKILFVENKNILTVPFEWFLYPIFLCSVRIMNFPLLVMSGYFVYRHYNKASLRQVLSWMFLIVITGMPFIARNYLLSGYPFFPSMSLAFIKPDWQADPVLVNNILHYIKYFNRINTAYLTIEETATIPFPYWPIKWYQYLFTYDKIIVTGGIGGSLLFLLAHKRCRQPLSFALLALCCQAILWAFIAPDPRFIYGIFMCGYFLGFIVLIGFFNATISQVISSAVPFFVALFMLTSVVRNLINHYHHASLLQPLSMQRPSTRIIRLEYQDVRIPMPLPGNWNPRCYDLTIPCLYEIDPRLRLRGNSLKYGFHLKKEQSR